MDMLLEELAMDFASDRFLTNRSVPAATVIPVLAYEDVGQAVAWLCEAFGFGVRLRIGGHRAQLTVGDGAVIVTDGGVGQGDEGRMSGHSVHVRVVDAEGHCARARARGARISQPPTDYPFGERQYTAEDLGGHRWTFSQSLADVAPETWGGMAE
jgi:uncharacterized glyoxalase superfamily protein PhnB